MGNVYIYEGNEYKKNCKIFDISKSRKMVGWVKENKLYRAGRENFR